MSSDSSAAVDYHSMSRSSSEASIEGAPDAPNDDEIQLASLPAADLVDHLYRHPGREDLFDDVALVLADRERRLAEAEDEIQAAHKVADGLLDDIRKQEEHSPDVATTTMEAFLKDEVRARDRRIAEVEDQLRGTHKFVDFLLDDINNESTAAEAMVARLRNDIGVRDRRLVETRAQIRRAAETEASLRAELQERDRAVAALEAELNDVRRRQDDARRPPSVPSPPQHGQVTSNLSLPVPVEQRDANEEDMDIRDE